MKELPKLFQLTKNEFTKATNAFWRCHTKTDVRYEETKNYKMNRIETKHIDVESYGEYWLILKDVLKTIENEESTFSEKLKTVMDENNTNIIRLPKYNKKIIFNYESEWFDVEELNSSDWEIINKESNEKYLNK